MQIDYEISEKDYRDGQRLALKGLKSWTARWILFALPAVGFLLLVYLIKGAISQGFSIGFVPGFVICLWWLSMPIITRRAWNKVYAKSNSMHGKLSLVVDDTGIHFEGPTASSNATWEHFSGFIEDEKAFVLLQKNGRIFNFLPKRFLSATEIEEFRQITERHLARK